MVFCGKHQGIVRPGALYSTLKCSALRCSTLENRISIAWGATFVHLRFYQGQRLRFARKQNYLYYVSGMNRIVIFVMVLPP